MVRALLLLLVVAACHSAPPPQPPLIAQHTAPRTAPRPVEENPSPDWVPHARARGRTVVTSTSITILDDLKFLPGSASIDPRTTPILDAFATTMLGNPELKLITVRIFAADVAPHWQQIVADMRARNVVDYVVAKGVARARLRPEGVPRPPPGITARMQFEVAQRGP